MEFNIIMDGSKHDLIVYRRRSVSLFIIIASFIFIVAAIFGVFFIPEGATISVSFSREIVVPDTALRMYSVVNICILTFLFPFVFQEIKILFRVAPLIKLTKDSIRFQGLLYSREVKWQHIEKIKFIQRPVFRNIKTTQMCVSYFQNVESKSLKKFACNATVLTTSKEELLGYLRENTPSFVQKTIEEISL